MRKRKAEPGLNGCPGPEVAETVVTSRTPLYMLTAKATTVGQLAKGVPEGVVTNTDAAEMTYVAVGESSTAEAFWALLESVGYTVW